MLEFINCLLAGGIFSSTPWWLLIY